MELKLKDEIILYFNIKNKNDKFRFNKFYI